MKFYLWMKLYLAERLQAARELGGEGLIAVMPDPKPPGSFRPTADGGDFKEAAPLRRRSRSRLAKRNADAYRRFPSSSLSSTTPKSLECAFWSGSANPIADSPLVRISLTAAARLGMRCLKRKSSMRTNSSGVSII
jgi:hypothetical protein